jgi:formate hydrogenlyase subunit 6/NADH:ubiquinone oxidoreductase subunit I
VKPKEVEKAQVIDELCTGCSFCVDVCPVDCITLIPEPDGVPGSPVHIVARVDERTCISCKICEHVCIKDAIVVQNEVPFQDNIGWSFQYTPNEENRIIGSYSNQITSDTPLKLAEYGILSKKDKAKEKITEET